MTLEKFGRYEIIYQLGEGGMAEVYAARDPMMDRQVALKIIRKNFSEDANFQERFWSEAKTIAGLEHRAILPVHDFGKDERTNKLYLVMRLMPDVLHKRLERSGTIPLEDASLILNRLAAALNTAHVRGIVHRDIKPQNILLDEDGTVFLADFGLAAPVDKIENGFVPSAYGGSPFYMAPEQWQGDTVGPHTDIYQLGVTLFEMLVGERPFPETDMQLLLDRHVNGRVPLVKDYNDRLPSKIQPILEKAMAKNPLDRHKTCLELAEEVANLLRPKQIKNRYEIKEELQHGRLAAVYLARDLFEERDVALKVVKHALIPYQAYQQQFQNQRQQLMSLPEHTAVVPIYDVDQHNGQPYIAMKFVDGASLRERFRKERVFSVEMVCRFAEALAAALDALHEANRTHGDINLGNVLLDMDDNCYLTDVHITAVAELTKAVLDQKSPLGYTPYMAPEQWRGEPIGSQTDVYQFGVMIFELLTGQLPFAGASDEELRNAIENSIPPKVTSFKPELPAQFDTILARAMAKEPEARFARASEVINRLIQAREHHIFETLKHQGDAFYEERQWEQAIELYTQALNLKPESQEVQSALDRAKRRKRDSGIFYQSKLAEEEQHWQEATRFLELASDSPEKKERMDFLQRKLQVEQRYNAGKMALAEQDWTTAQKYFDQTDMLEPNYEDVNQLLGQLEEKIEGILQQAQTAVAQEKYEAALALLAPLADHEKAVALRHEIATKAHESRRNRRWSYFARYKRLIWGVLGLLAIAAVVVLVMQLRNRPTFEEACVETAVPLLRVQNGAEKIIVSMAEPGVVTGDWQALALAVDWGPADLSAACREFILQDGRVAGVWNSTSGNHIDLIDDDQWQVVVRPSASSEDHDTIVVSLSYNNQQKAYEFQLNFVP